jgi:hypothetical protein
VLVQLSSLAVHFSFKILLMVQLVALTPTVQNEQRHRKLHRQRRKRTFSRGRERVALNLTLRNSTLAASAMKSGQRGMIGFASVKRVPLFEGLY